MTNDFPRQLGAMIARDLRALRREIEAYPDDASVWATPAGISNSAGTLALHLVGNLRCYIGAEIGGDGYVRDRPLEFSARNLPRAELVRGIDAAAAAVAAAMPKLDDATLASEYPQALGPSRLNTQDFLLHVAAHLTYHLGQIDYHRRIVTGSSVTVGTISSAELFSARPVAS